MTKQGGSNCNAPDFYSWGFRFNYRPAHRLSWYSSHPPGRC